jgi:hypothetical protein
MPRFLSSRTTIFSRIRLANARSSVNRGERLTAVVGSKAYWEFWDRHLSEANTPSDSESGCQVADFQASGPSAW